MRGGGIALDLAKCPALQGLGSGVVDGEILVESAEHTMTNGAAVGGAAERQDEVQRHRPGGGPIELSSLDVADESPQGPACLSKA